MTLLENSQACLTLLMWRRTGWDNKSAQIDALPHYGASRHQGINTQQSAGSNLISPTGSLIAWAASIELWPAWEKSGGAGAYDWEKFWRHHDNIVSSNIFMNWRPAWGPKWMDVTYTNGVNQGLNVQTFILREINLLWLWSSLHCFIYE